MKVQAGFSLSIETRESRALKYFVNNLTSDVFKKVSQLCPVNFQNAIAQAKMIEEDLAKTASKKEPAFIEVILAQVCHESISNKNYESIKQQLAALSNVINSHNSKNNSVIIHPLFNKEISQANHQSNVFIVENLAIHLESASKPPKNT